MNYYEKYVKYKSKYLELIDKNYVQRGGHIPFIIHPYRINLFVDEHMLQYLNPIYGYVMYKTGFILNTYHLNKSRFIKTPISYVIKKCCKIETGGMIRPTDKIVNFIKPIDFGRYIAIKYINMTLEGGIFNKIELDRFIFIDSIQTNNTIKKILTTSINKLNKFIPIAVKNGVDYNEKIYFHIILYCMWWTANNDDGITQYYNGINEVFSIIQKLGQKYDKYKQIEIVNPPDNSFESQLIDATQETFTIYNQEQSQHFCSNYYDGTTHYSDCGEVTARNLINLLCFNGAKFDITILEKFSAIPELINYYKTFNTFQRQSIVNISDNPELTLNAIDAWSRLIILYANYNIKFNQECNDDGEGGGGSKATFGFNVKSGLALDSTISNFLQLIKNLLHIENWDNLEEIMTIEDNTNSGGFGDIDITHEKFGKFVIHCRDGHYNMEAIEKTNKEIIYDGLNGEQIEIIKKVFSRVSINDYMWMNIDPNQLVSIIGIQGHNEINLFKLPLLQLSITDQFDSGVRRRIWLNTNESYFNDFIDTCKEADLLDKLKEYNYTSHNFDFMNNPSIARVNINMMNIHINHHISEIDLSPLSGLTEIGTMFLNDYYNLKYIDLSPLSQVKTIGNNFLWRCKSLQKIDSSPSRVGAIGNSFVDGCSNLQKIDLAMLAQVKTIGNWFLRECNSLTELNLSPLANINTIGYSFLQGCTGLTELNLSSLSKVKTIGDNFLSHCSKLQKIHSSPSQVKTINDAFAYRCSDLREIDLALFSQAKTIGNFFLEGCTGLTELNLSPLANINTIGDNFLQGCTGLTELNLSPLARVQTIGDEFLSGCTRLTTIDLSGLSQLTKISRYFLNRVPNLRTVFCDQEQYELIKNSLVKKDILHIK